MKNTLIGLLLLIFGLACSGYFGFLIFRTITLPITGQTAIAKVTGYKISSNGARKVEKSQSSSSIIKGRSPWFEFETKEKQKISTYSASMQLINFFNYEIGDEVKVAYPANEPEKAIIISWKEFPGLLFMLLFGLLIIFVSKSYLLNLER